ncbi:hypothetical protein, partial [Salmonella sp. SAL4445]|uniref:hypothetical protein n=1 Tax=Salmonella sp. SAL4445 TaxID=3159900 RepID=UPI003979539A
RVPNDHSWDLLVKGQDILVREVAEDEVFGGSCYSGHVEFNLLSPRWVGGGGVAFTTMTGGTGVWQGGPKRVDVEIEGGLMDVS